MKNVLTVVLCVCIVFLFIGLLPVHGETQIYDSVLRLHVVANSNSEEDQRVKLDVKDRIAELTDELCKECANIEEARRTVEENLSLILERVSDELQRQGFDYPIRITLGEEDYPKKEYASLCFPSGRYLSLQILLGEALGENWWCVLFPPLCLDVATGGKSNEDAFISVGFTSDQYKVITETDEPVYEARFKILEVIEKAVNG